MQEGEKLQLLKFLQLLKNERDRSGAHPADIHNRSFMSMCLISRNFQQHWTLQKHESFPKLINKLDLQHILQLIFPFSLNQ